ncbi:hypothetical protein HGM15179_002846, partial [Zosterops borbonicus]
KSCSEVIYWFCFPARGLVLIYFAASPEASSRLKCRHCILGWAKYWQENTFGSFNWKNTLLLSPRGQGSATAAQGGQGNRHTTARCSGSHLPGEFGGSTKVPTSTGSHSPVGGQCWSPGLSRIPQPRGDNADPQGDNAGPQGLSRFLQPHGDSA